MSQRRALCWALLFISPWVLGFCAFMLYPVLASLYYSFCDYSVLEPPLFIGLENYQELVQDVVFWISLKNTVVFAIFSLGLGLLVSLSLAFLLNMKVRGMSVYRTIFFLPSLVPAVALAVLWMWLFNGDAGLVNMLLERCINTLLAPVNAVLGGNWSFTAPNWLGSKQWAMPALILMSLWGVGQPIVIYLAGLQDIPVELYEAAEIDGASPLQKVFFISLPMLSPVIYFNFIMGIIWSFQVFTVPYIMTRGGPERATYFYAMAIYDSAFEDLHMGYACAMAWILFLIILCLTLLATRFSQRWVQYER